MWSCNALTHATYSGEGRCPFPDCCTALSPGCGIRFSFKSHILGPSRVSGVPRHRTISHIEFPGETRLAKPADWRSDTGQQHVPPQGCLWIEVLNSYHRGELEWRTPGGRSGCSC